MLGESLPYPLGIAHPGKLSLQSYVTIQSWERTIKDITRKSPSTSTPWLTHAVISLCDSLYPTQASDWPNRLSPRDCARCSRPFADAQLASILSPTSASAEALSRSRPSCLFFWQLPLHGTEAPGPTSCARGIPTPGTTHRRWLPAPQPAFREHRDPLEKKNHPNP